MRTVSQGGTGRNGDVKIWSRITETIKYIDDRVLLTNEDETLQDMID